MRYLFVPVLMLTGIAFLAAPTYAAEPTEAVKSAVVNIYCTYSSGKKTYSSTGSGVLIGNRGVILTNAHVTLPFLISGKDAKNSKGCVIRTGSPAKDRYTADLLYISPTWIKNNTKTVAKNEMRGNGREDFALLHITGAKEGTLPETFPGLPFAEVTSLPLVETIELLVSGYPAAHLSYKEVGRALTLQAATSTVTSVRTFERPYHDVVVMSPSEVGSAGVSGGPITRPSGELVAIATAVGTGSKAEERSLRAITLAYIDRTLRTNASSSLSSFIAGDLKTRAEHTRNSLTPSLLRSITKALLGRS